MMGLRERWRRMKERNRKIDEAIDRQLTPEQKLAFEYSSRANKSTSTIPFMLGVIAVLCVLATASIVVSFNATFEDYFGKENWENMQEVTSAHREEIVGLQIAPWCVVGIVIIWFVPEVIYALRRNRRITKLEHEILTQLDAGDKK